MMARRDGTPEMRYPRWFDEYFSTHPEATPAIATDVFMRTFYNENAVRGGQRSYIMRFAQASQERINHANQDTPSS